MPQSKSKNPTTHSWTWQLQNRITALPQLLAYQPSLKSHNLLKDALDVERDSTKKQHNLQMAITPYYANLINLSNPLCPILLQSLPSKMEINDSVHTVDDPLAEETNMPVRGLTHRYPDRVLWYTTHHCAVYCRYCMRKRKVSDPKSAPIKDNTNQIIEYIKNHTQIKEVILSGGDPLTLSDSALDYILCELKDIAHLKSIRIHTRVPVTLPMRITKELCLIFKKHYPLTIVTHFNHPIEITQEATQAIQDLRFSGVHILNQSVLLKSINDTTQIMQELLLALIKSGAMPYYLHRCDDIPGSSHFQVPVQRGLEILQEIRGKNPGIAIPRYMIDLPGGGGKIPLEVNYKTKTDHIIEENGIRSLHFFNTDKKKYTIREKIE